MKFCKRCGERIEAEDKFCSACGAPVTEERFERPESSDQQQHPAADNTGAAEHTSAADQTAARNHFEKQFEEGYYSAPIPPTEPPKKKGGNGKVVIGAIIGIVVLAAIGLISSIMFVGKDKKTDVSNTINGAVEAETEKHDVLDETKQKEQAASGEVQNNNGSDVLANIDAARASFEPGLASLGFIIDDSHISADDTSVYYFMWDTDNTAFVISFSSDKVFDDLQLYSCGWEQEVKLLELCEQQLGISFAREELEGIKKEAEDASQKEEDHYGFSDYIYAGEYMCSLMVSPYSDDEQVNEYSLFVSKQYTETASK